MNSEVRLEYVLESYPFFILAEITRKNRIAHLKQLIDYQLYNLLFLKNLQLTDILVMLIFKQGKRT